MKYLKIIVALVSMFYLVVGNAQADNASALKFQEFAYSGKFGEGKRQLLQIAVRKSDDVEAVFGAGALQFFLAVSNLQKSLFEYGVGNVSEQRLKSFARRSVPIFRLPVPPNPDPKTASYEIARGILEQFVEDLSEARSILARIEGKKVKLPLNPFLIGLDLDMDGAVSDQENLLKAILLVSGNRAMGTDSFIPQEIHFDTADVSWLQGYSNLLIAVANFFLAFDFQNSYEVSFQMFFGDQATEFGRLKQAYEKRIVSDPEKRAQYEKILSEISKLNEKLTELKNTHLAEIKKLNDKRDELSKEPKTAKTWEEIRDLGQEIDRLRGDRVYLELKGDIITEIRSKRKQLRETGFRDGTSVSGFVNDDVLSLVSFVHTLNWPVHSRQRLLAVRADLLEVVRLNHVTWRAVRAETDNDHEWLPNQSQKGPFPGIRVTDKLIDGWLKTIGLANDILVGNKLIPHFHYSGGIDLRRFLEEIDNLDFVLYLTGPGVLKYMANDRPVVSSREWRSITRPFGRNFGLFLLWFN